MEMVESRGFDVWWSQPQSLPGRHARADQLRPHLALAVPMWNNGNGADVPLADRVAALDCAGEEQDSFLDVRGEVK